jgi:hypothetical protein
LTSLIRNPCAKFPQPATQLPRLAQATDPISMVPVAGGAPAIPGRASIAATMDGTAIRMP